MVQDPKWFSLMFHMQLSSFYFNFSLKYSPQVFFFFLFLNEDVKSLSSFLPESEGMHVRLIHAWSHCLAVSFVCVTLRWPGDLSLVRPQPAGISFNPLLTPWWIKSFTFSRVLPFYISRKSRMCAISTVLSHEDVLNNAKIPLPQEPNVSNSLPCDIFFFSFFFFWGMCRISKAVVMHFVSATSCVAP